MSSAVSLHLRFPNLRPEVVDGYLNAPEHMTAEVLDGELFVMTRPHRRHARGAGKLWRLAGRSIRSGRPLAAG